MEKGALGWKLFHVMILHFKKSNVDFFISKKKDCLNRLLYLVQHIPNHVQKKTSVLVPGKVKTFDNCHMGTPPLQTQDVRG